MEGELFLFGFVEQGHDLRHFGVEIVVATMKGSSLPSEFLKEEVGL